MLVKKKSIKRLIIAITAILLCILLIFLSVYISGTGAPKSANDYSKAVADVSEAVERFFERVTYSNNKIDGYSPITEIPETENGYVPQGFCYCEKLGMYLISYYHAENPSILALIDAESHEHIKTVNLYDESNNAFTGHVGGIDSDGEYLYITCEESVARVRLNKLKECDESLILTEYFYTDVKCSYLNCDSEYIYVGEFYTGGGNYDTNEDHHIMVTPLDVSFARVNIYKLSDLDFSGDSKTPLTPEYSFAVPNRVQGIVRLNDESFVLSVSYGRKNYSYLYIYENPLNYEPQYTYSINGSDVPVYFFLDDYKTNTVTLPPLLEGIDIKDNKVLGIFESGAEKYSDAKQIENNICQFH